MGVTKFQPTGKAGGLRVHLGNKTKVAIVGFCNDSRDMAPYEDPSIVCWGLNRGYIFMPKADVWFDLHGPHIYLNQERRPGNHRDWLAQFPGPVYMHRADPDIPNSVAYPLDEISQNLGINLWRTDGKGKQWDTTGEPYITSSIAFEIALAIYEGYEEIHLYGIDLNTESEYAWQKPGVEYLLGVAIGRGIKVVLPDNCPLLKGKLYGRGYLSPQGEAMSLEQLETRLKSIQQEQADVTKALSEMLGAKRELDFIMDQLVPGLDHERLDQRRKKMQDAIAQYNQRLLQIHGGLKETSYWIHQTPAGQNPKEALDQLRADGHKADSDGPVDELALMYYEPETVPVGA